MSSPNDISTSGSANQSNFENDSSSDLPMAAEDSNKDNADKSTMTMPVIQQHHKCKNCVRKSETIKNLQRKIRRWRKFIKLKKKSVAGKKEVNTFLMRSSLHLGDLARKEKFYHFIVKRHSYIALVRP